MRCDWIGLLLLIFFFRHDVGVEPVVVFGKRLLSMAFVLLFKFEIFKGLNEFEDVLVFKVLEEVWYTIACRYTWYTVNYNQLPLLKGKGNDERQVVGLGI